MLGRPLEVCASRAAVLVAGERGRVAVREQRLQRRGADGREQARVKARECLVVPLQKVEGTRDEVAAGGARRVVRLRARRDFDAARVARARADVAVDRERGLRRVELLEPFGRGDVGLAAGSSPARPLRRTCRRRCARSRRTRRSPCARGSGTCRAAARSTPPFSSAANGRVEVGVGAAGRHAHAARRFGLRAPC